MDSQQVKIGRGVGRPRDARPDPARIAAARADLDRVGKTIADWARENDEDPDITYRVLSGLRACRNGDSHRIAVKLGIKDGQIAADPALARSDFGAMAPAR